jgi:hypothetical protein
MVIIVAIVVIMMKFISEAQIVSVSAMKNDKCPICKIDEEYNCDCICHDKK